jgi:hypothetical protein
MQAIMASMVMKRSISKEAENQEELTAWIKDGVEQKKLLVAE